jgi:hypothetical protein
MSQFKDAVGDTWILDIKVADVERVKKLVFDKNGVPVDLLAITERGEFKQIKNDIETTLNIIQVLCLEQIGRRFNVAKYDAENEYLYEAVPEWRDESRTRKASRWLAARINHEVLPAMMEAFFEALLNFTSSPSRRAALKSIYDGESELEKLTCQETVRQMQAAVKRSKKIITETLEKTGETLPEKLRQAMEKASEGGTLSANAPPS